MPSTSREEERREEKRREAKKREAKRREEKRCVGEISAWHAPYT